MARARRPGAGMTIPRTASAEQQRFYEQIIQKIGAFESRVGTAEGRVRGLRRDVDGLDGPGTGDDGDGEVPILDTPPRPMNVGAFCGLGIVMITTENPFRVYANHARAIIYRNTVDDFDTAAEIGQAPWLTFVDDNVASNTEYFYWVLWESTAGVRGLPSESVSCTTAVDPEQVYAEILDWLNTSPLLAALQSDIDAATAIEEARRIAGTLTLLSADAAAEADRLRQALSRTVTSVISRLEVVEARTGAVPVDAIGRLSYDTVVAQFGTEASAQAFEGLAVLGEEVEVGPSGSKRNRVVYSVRRAGARVIVSLQLGVDWGMGSIELPISDTAVEIFTILAPTAADVDAPGEWFVQQVQVPEAIAVGVEGLTLRVDDTDMRLAAEVHRIDALTAALPGKADVSTVDALTARVTQNETDITAEAQRITDLTAVVGTKANASALDAVETRVTTNEGEIAANSLAITDLTAEVGPALGPEENEFTGVDRAAAEAAVDIYADADPAWLAMYDANPDLAIELTW